MILCNNVTLNNLLKVTGVLLSIASLLLQQAEQHVSILDSLQIYLKKPLGSLIEFLKQFISNGYIKRLKVKLKHEGGIHHPYWAMGQFH